MVLKSKKSKSKRSTLRHKYKVIKKVKQHLKKKAKEEKKARQSGKKPKGPKDPGIPGQWPFKEELLKDLEWQKQRILAQEKAKKDEKKLKRAAEKEVDIEDKEMVEPTSVEALQQEAARKQAVYAANKKPKLEKTPAAKDKDGTRRAFFKEFVKVVTAADVIIEVLDARDPLGSRCLDVERFARKAGADKKIILLLNKIDLVPREVAEAWLKYLRGELPTVAFKCSTQRQAVNLKQGRLSRSAGKGERRVSISSAALTGSDSLGAETLLQLLKNYARNADIKTAITVGIVGLPNVGKSSLINSLKRARVAQVGNAPGITRSVQQVNLDKHINLLDSPGIVFSAGDQGDAWAALRNCIKVEQLDNPQAIVAEILKRCPAKQLMFLYKIPAFKDADEFLQHVAFQRGRLLPGGIGDPKSAAIIVLHDWHNGKIAYFTMPPKRGSGEHEEAAIVTAWGEAFNADKVFANERNAVIAGLPSLEDENAVFFPTETAGTARLDLENMDAEAVGSAQDPATRGGDESGSEIDSQSDSDDSEAEEPVSLPGMKVPGTNSKEAAAVSAQAAHLYSEAGQFNPHAARAEKKRNKRQKKVSFGDDFNFAEAFAEEVKLGDEAANGSDENGGEMEEGDEVPE